MFPIVTSELGFITFLTVPNMIVALILMFAIYMFVKKRLMKTRIDVPKMKDSPSEVANDDADIDDEEPNSKSMRSYASRIVSLNDSYSHVFPNIG